MSVSDVGQRAGRPQGAGGPVSDLSAAKLLRPQLRAETIRRSSLIDRLAKDDGRPIVSVVAPAGYGKTTLLSQWAKCNGQAFAWVSVDEKDNDPKVLLSYVAEALDAIEPVGERVFEALASPASSVPGSVVPRLANAFSSMTEPVALVLDDVHLLDNSECRTALSILADHVPPGSRLVLAGRGEPPLRVARLRAEGRLVEIGPGDLSLTREEAASLLRAAEVALGDDDLAELHRRTEGWPVGLYLAALFLREGGSLPGAAATFGGDDRFVSEYMESEFLARISRPQRVFLTRTAVLERLSGPLCEAVLDQPGSAAALAELARSNLLLVPMDRRGKWYRYHHLFRDMLLAELERTEPDLIQVLQRRAADWFSRNGQPEEALEYSMAARDVEMAARLVEKLWHLTYRQGRVTTLQQWFQWLDEQAGIEGHPLAAVFASMTAGAIGRPAEAERWADAVDRWQHQKVAGTADPATEAWAALLRAWMCRRGVKQMRADATEAAHMFATAGIVAPAAPLAEGIACILCGDLDGGNALFEHATDIGGAGGPHIRAYTLCEQSLVAMARNQWDRAEGFASQARAMLRQAGIEDAFVCAVHARVAMHRGDVPAARQQLVAAQPVRRVLTSAEPHLAVQARIELARVHLALADVAGARTLMREIDELFKRRPGLGTLVGEAQALRAQLSQRHGPDAPGASALTGAELRLLPLLSTHLTFAEIGAELFLSPNTVKTQAVSIYRKLDASTRGQAVARARELGLLEGYTTASHPIG
jgi:LuxR family transcriptional regulator, maltose regulon positive regulatory protein